MRIITLGDGKRMTLSSYLKAVKYAKAHPDAEFERGFTCWWPCSGREIMQQFRAGMMARINDAIPYSQRV